MAWEINPWRSDEENICTFPIYNLRTTTQNALKDNFKVQTHWSCVENELQFNVDQIC